MSSAPESCSLLQPSAGKSICGTDDTRVAVCIGTTTASQRSQPMVRFSIGGCSLCTSGIFVAQHWSGNPMQIVTASSRDSRSYRVIGRSTTVVAYLCDTRGGSSGSLAYATSSRIDALHRLGRCTNQGERINKVRSGVSTYFLASRPDPGRSCRLIRLERA